MRDLPKSTRRGKRNYDEDGTAFDHDGLVDVEATISDREFDQEYAGTKIPPNPPPKKVGKVDAKTICRRAASELMDCGSHMTLRVMLFYIDSANRNTGACYPSVETTARKLRISERAVERANRFWVKAGFLTVPRCGRSTPTRRSNAYHVQWFSLITYAANHHWCADIRAEARLSLGQICRLQGTNLSLARRQICRPNPGNINQGNKSRDIKRRTLGQRDASVMRIRERQSGKG